MSEGDVVMVAGKLDDRVRDNSDSSRVGTIIHINETDALVLFENGDIWKGPTRHLFPIKEQS